METNAISMIHRALKKLRHLTFLRLSCFFLMDSSNEETPRQKFMNSELVSHQLKSPQKKSRANSVNGELDNEDKYALRSP